MPNYCPVDYECVSVSLTGLQSGSAEPISCATLNMDLVFDGDDTDGKLSFTPTLADYESGLYPAGDYVITFKGTARYADPEDTETIQVTMTLIDPCSNV